MAKWLKIDTKWSQIHKKCWKRDVKLSNERKSCLKVKQNKNRHNSLKDIFKKLTKISYDCATVPTSHLMNHNLQPEVHCSLSRPSSGIWLASSDLSSGKLKYELKGQFSFGAVGASDHVTWAFSAGTDWHIFVCTSPPCPLLRCI